MLCFLGAVLYDAQVVNGTYWADRSKTKISNTETVTASRGNLLDRYGRVLVSNQVTYQVTLNPSVMGKERNQVLATLLEVSRQSGVEWADALPITADSPFSYTTDSPFCAISTNEDGTTKTSLTRLGRLAVKMKWIEDPTKTPGVTLPTAEELLGRMCKSFELAGAGAVDPAISASVPVLNIGDMDPADARAIAGVLYEVYLRSKDIYYTPYVFAEDVDIDFISRVKERSLAGVNVDPVSKRQYNTPYAAHLLGRIGPIYENEWEYYSTIDRDGDGVRDYQMDDYVGKEGAESAFEEYLRGTPGKRQVDRDTTGKIVDETWIIEPDPGNNVILTLDIDLQKAVEDALANGIPRLASDESEGAACVVLAVNSGEVLAGASYPTYDPATYSQDYNINAANPLKPFLNRAFMGLYAPGSTFKMVTAIAGLEEGYITPETVIVDNGRYT